jgi:hypothetical protein
MSKIIFTFILWVSISCLPVSAGIIDTNNDSFIDSDTNLEWMDFGINNHETFFVVKNKTKNNGEYKDWSVATETQVRELWFNAFFNTNPRIYRPNQNVKSWGEAIDWTDDENTFSTLWDPIYEIMGYNTILRPGNDAEQKAGFGYYEANNGYLYRAQFVNYTNSNILTAEREFYDSASLSTYDRFEARNSHNIAFSTMLVKSVKVPEPSTLFLFLAAFVFAYSPNKSFKRTKNSWFLLLRRLF